MAGSCTGPRWAAHSPHCSVHCVCSVDRSSWPRRRGAAGRAGEGPIRVAYTPAQLRALPPDVLQVAEYVGTKVPRTVQSARGRAQQHSACTPDTQQCKCTHSPVISLARSRRRRAAQAARPGRGGCGSFRGWVVEIMLFPRAENAFFQCFCHADIQMAGVNGYIPAKKWHN